MRKDSHCRHSLIGRCHEVTEGQACAPSKMSALPTKGLGARSKGPAMNYLLSAKFWFICLTAVNQKVIFAYGKLYCKQVCSYIWLRQVIFFAKAGESWTLTASRLLFSANSSVFSLLGVSQAASNTKQLSQKFLIERCFAVYICLFFKKIRQNGAGMLTHFKAF